MSIITNKVEKSIANELPNYFGIMFDGWTHHNTHYIALHACYQVGIMQYYPLLAFQPLLEEDDMSSEGHLEYLKSTLELYNKTLVNVSFLVGDNCNVNKSLSKITDIPMIGCYSHRLTWQSSSI